MSSLAGKILEHFVPALDHPNSSLAHVKRIDPEDWMTLMQEIDSVALEGREESHEAGLVARSYSQIHLPFDTRNFHDFELQVESLPYCLGEAADWGSQVG